MKIIVVALDGSELAEQCIASVTALARAAQAKVVLASVIVAPDRWSRGEVMGEEIDEEKSIASFYLESVRDRLRENGVMSRSRVESGRAAETLLAIAEDESADLIALTTHGRSGFTRWILGSVADRVLHTSPKPLLLIHAATSSVQKEAGLQRILVPLDGSDLAESVLPMARRLAADTGAALVLHEAVVPAAALYAGALLPSAPPVLQEVEEGCKEYLDGIAAGMGRAGIDVTTRVDVGYPAETILETARELDVDLIALCTHGRSGPQRWVMGSVADAVVRHAGCPCLVVPAPRPAPAPENTLEVPAGILVAGNAVVPPPTMREAPVPEGPAVHAPAARPHRPERSPWR